MSTQNPHPQGHPARTLDAETITGWLEASCASQCIALKVTDPVVMADVLTLLGGPLPGREPHPRARRKPGVLAGSLMVGLDAPVGGYPVDVEGVGTPGARGDHGMVQDAADDGLTPVQTQRRPSAA